MNFWNKKKNTVFTRKETILGQLTELRPLPLGRKEFEEWSDRIISGALLPATAESQKFALAEMIMHIKPTEDHVDDAYFIKCLRKSAANQIAYAVMEELRALAKARLSKEAEDKKLKLVEPGAVPPPPSGNSEPQILADKKV